MTDRRRKTFQRKLWVLLHVVVLLLACLVQYIGTGCPPMNLEHQFRRAEKAQCVGPADILGTEKLQGNSLYEYVLLAENQNGTTMYLYNNDSFYGFLHYRKKVGDMQVLAVPTFNYFAGGRKKIVLPVIAFNRDPHAVRAELELMVSGIYGTETTTQTYHAEANRENPGYFCFTISQSGWGAQIQALENLSAISGSDSYGTLFRFPVTVRLYDENGQLLREVSTEIVSAAMDAQKEANA